MGERGPLVANLRAALRRPGLAGSRLLLLGDSQERNMLHLVCEHMQGRYSAQQGSYTDRTRFGGARRWGQPHVCHVSPANISILQFFHFGVVPNATPAILKHHACRDEVTALPERLHYLPGGLLSGIGSPTHVVAHSGLWDLLKLCNESHDRALRMLGPGQRYEHWLRTKLLEPLRALFPNSRLSWRTLLRVRGDANNQSYVNRGCALPPYEQARVTLAGAAGESAARAVNVPVLNLARAFDDMISERGEQAGGCQHTSH